MSETTGALLYSLLSFSSLSVVLFWSRRGFFCGFLCFVDLILRTSFSCRVFRVHEPGREARKFRRGVCRKCGMFVTRDLTGYWL